MEPNKQEVILKSDSKVNMTLRIMKLLKKTPRTFEAVVVMMILVTVASVKGQIHKLVFDGVVGQSCMYVRDPSCKTCKKYLAYKQCFYTNFSTKIEESVLNVGSLENLGWPYMV